MLRSHHCGALNENHSNQEVTLAGWVQKVRNKGFIVWTDLRDRYGITQLIFDEERTPKTVFKKSLDLGREDVIQIKGKVIERESKNSNMATGGIEILVEELTVLNAAKTPPFTIENQTDGGDELRMQYRYLDLRRAPVRDNLIFRHKVHNGGTQFFIPGRFYRCGNSLFDQIYSRRGSRFCRTLQNEQRSILCPPSIPTNF